MGKKFRPKKSFESRIIKRLFLYAPKLTGVFLRDRKKDIHLYCLGLPRTGTHSMAHVFMQSFRSRHEPLPSIDLPFIIKNANNANEPNAQVWKEFILLRDKYLNLEVEASQYLRFFLPTLPSLYPLSKYILTIREPISWLESYTCGLLRLRGGTIWVDYKIFLHGPISVQFDTKSTEDLKILFKQILSYGLSHIEAVLKHVPKSRLLVIDTFLMKESSEQVHDFLGINQGRIPSFNMHRGKKEVKPFLISVYKEEDWFIEMVDDFKLKLNELFDLYDVDTSLIGEKLKYKIIK